MDAETKQQLSEVLSHYEGITEELITVSQEAQVRFSYLPAEVIRVIARFLKLPESVVFGVSTFYSQFKFVPAGRHIVRICRGTACHVRGAPRVMNEEEKRLGIKPGETTGDMEYSLDPVAGIPEYKVCAVRVEGKSASG